MKHFIPAASFSEHGGWVVETQSLETIGSSYLMAHGLGIPVADAYTYVELPKGEYKLYALTRDWTAVWGRGSAGKFELLADDKPLALLGTNGKDWDWQFAGVITGGRIKLSLRDLTGFNGRCAGLFLTDSDDAPEIIKEPIID